jgi:hypothetical protein
MHLPRRQERENKEGIAGPHLPVILSAIQEGTADPQLPMILSAINGHSSLPPYILSTLINDCPVFF